MMAARNSRKQDQDQADQEAAEQLAAQEQAEQEAAEQFAAQAEAAAQGTADDEGSEAEGTAQPDGEGSTEAEPEYQKDEDGNPVLGEDGEPLLVVKAPSPFTKVMPPLTRAAAAFNPDPALLEVLKESYDSKDWYSVANTHYGNTKGKTIQYLRKAANTLGYGLAVREYEEVVSFQARVKKQFG